MNKIVLVILVLLLVGGIWYASNQSDTTMEGKNDDAMMMEKDEKMSGDTMMEDSKTMEMSDDAMMKKDDSEMMEDDSMMMEKADSMMNKVDSAMMKSGSYEMYSAEKLALANEGDVVLFFKASWCPTCRALDTDIKNNLSDIPEGVTILEIDYDQSSDLKKKYGVTSQHTLVKVDANGNMLDKWLGSPTLSALVAKI